MGCIHPLPCFCEVFLIVCQVAVELIYGTFSKFFIQSGACNTDLLGNLGFGKTLLQKSLNFTVLVGCQVLERTGRCGKICLMHAEFSFLVNVDSTLSYYRVSCLSFYMSEFILQLTVKNTDFYRYQNILYNKHLCGKIK